MGIVEELKGSAVSANKRIGDFLEAEVKGASFTRLLFAGLVLGVFVGAFLVLNKYAYDLGAAIVALGQTPLAVFSVFAENLIIVNLFLLLGSLSYLIGSETVKKWNKTKMKLPKRFHALYAYFVAFAVILFVGMALEGIDQVLSLPYLIFLAIEFALAIFALYFVATLMSKLYDTSILEFIAILILSHIIFVVIIVAIGIILILASLGVYEILKIAGALHS